MTVNFKNSAGTDLDSLFYTDNSNGGVIGFLTSGGVDLGNKYTNKSTLGYNVGYKNSAGTDLGYLRGNATPPALNTSLQKSSWNKVSLKKSSSSCGTEGDKSCTTYYYGSNGYCTLNISDSNLVKITRVDIKFFATFFTAFDWHDKLGIRLNSTDSIGILCTDDPCYQCDSTSRTDLSGSLDYKYGDKSYSSYRNILNTTIYPNSSNVAYRFAVAIARYYKVGSNANIYCTLTAYNEHGTSNSTTNTINLATS